AHVLDSPPLGHHHEQRPAVLAPEHAGEAGLVELDPLEHLAALADAPARGLALVHDRAPDGALRVQADAIAFARTAEVGPDAAVPEAAVGGDPAACRLPTS